MEDRPLDDDSSIHRAQQGDLSAYEELVVRYQEIAYRTAWFMLGDAALAEDVAQIALTRAYRALPLFRRDAAFRPWLLAIVANEARNQRRSAGRQRGLQLRLAEDRSPGGAVPSPEAAVLGREQREELLRAIEALPDHDREAITMRYFLDLSEGEMAAALGCARGTVKSRLSRALGRLRTLWDAQEDRRG